MGLLLALERVFRLVGYALRLKDEYIAALAARNGLELKVWALYATSSESNARRLHDDQIVDVRDVLRRLNDLRKLVPASEMPSGLDAEVDGWNQGMAQKATEFTVTEQDKYLRTHTLAKEAGCGEEYAGLFPILSKMLHPTAMSMMISQSQDDVENQIAHSCHMGLGYCGFVLNHLNGHLKSSGLPYLDETGQLVVAVP